MAVANIKKRYFDRVIDKILENILGYWFVWFINAQGYVAPAGLKWFISGLWAQKR